MKLVIIISLTISSVLYVNLVHSANILCVFPAPAQSHQSIYQPIWKELSLRGHKVTVLTPNPLRDPTLTNLTEIDLSFIYDFVAPFFPVGAKLYYVKTTPYIIYKRFVFVMDVFSQVAELTLSHPVVQSFLNDKSQHFDIVLAEWLFPTYAAFGAKYKCPIVGINSFGAPTPALDTVGNPAHPAYYPDHNLPIEPPLSFFERVGSTAYSLFIRLYHHLVLLPTGDKHVKTYIGEDLPYLGDIERNISMLLLNVNRPLYAPVPNVPAVVEFGGTYSRPKKPLPEDLKNILDEAKQGVIYFSLGTVVRAKKLPKRIVNSLVETFKELPYKILWKSEADLPKLPDNVIVRQWFPQTDLLGHPNVKVFMTQGGAQSIEEAIHHHVPLVALPVFADQPSNAKRVERLKIGKSLNLLALTKETLKETILEVIRNPSYKQNIKEVESIASDVQINGLENVVWWTEYVIRHKGARHLRSPIVDMPWYQYLLLDVVAFFVTLLVITLFILCKISASCWNVIRKYSRKPNKIKKN